MNESVLTTFRHTFHQFSQREIQKLCTVPEDDVLSPLDLKVSLHVLANELDFSVDKSGEGE
jgi:hypothetical protein